MAKTPRKPAAKNAATNVIALKPSDMPAGAELKMFTKGDNEHPGFTFMRYWWVGDGHRAGIEPWVRKKLSPGDDPVFGRATRHEVLIPDGAPTEYADLDFLLKRFDETQPPFEKNVFIQAKFALEPAWTASYERVRAFARSHFANGLGHPVILVAHVPSKVALVGPAHAHCIVPGRPLSIDGLGSTNHPLCSDRGYEETLAAWRRHLAGEAK